MRHASAVSFFSIMAPKTLASSAKGRMAMDRVFVQDFAIAFPCDPLVAIDVSPVCR
jgi:hypothetical protein